MREVLSVHETEELRAFALSTLRNLTSGPEDAPATERRCDLVTPLCGTDLFQRQLLMLSTTKVTLLALQTLNNLVGPPIGSVSRESRCDKLLDIKIADVLFAMLRNQDSRVRQEALMALVSLTTGADGGERVHARCNRLIDQKALTWLRLSLMAWAGDVGEFEQLAKWLLQNLDANASKSKTKDVKKMLRNIQS